MRRILLVRHGETEWNAIGRLQGHSDVPLNEAGRAQARSLAASVADAGIATIVTSDLARARETGEIVAAALGLDAPGCDPDLREGWLGVFEGLTQEECAERYPDVWLAWRDRFEPPTGAEPPADALARLARALERIADGDGGPVLVISHGGVIRLLLSDVHGELAPPVPNAAVYTLERDDRGFRVRPGYSGSADITTSTSTMPTAHARNAPMK